MLHLHTAAIFLSVKKAMSRKEASVKLKSPFRQMPILTEIVGLVTQTTLKVARFAGVFQQMPIPDTTVITGFVIKAMKRKGAAVFSPT